MCHELIADLDFVLRGKAILQWSETAGDLRKYIEAELKFLAHRCDEIPRGIELVTIYGGNRHSDGDGEGLSDQMSQALLKLSVRTWDSGHLFVRRFCGSVDRYVDLVDSDLFQQNGKGRCDTRRVCKQIDDVSTESGVTKNVSNVRAYAGFTAGECDRKHAEVGEVIQECQYLNRSQLVRQGSVRRIVAVDASKITTVSQLECHFLGRAVCPCSSRKRPKELL